MTTGLDVTPPRESLATAVIANFCLLASFGGAVQDRRCAEPSNFIQLRVPFRLRVTTSPESGSLTVMGQNPAEPAVMLQTITLAANFGGRLAVKRAARSEMRSVHVNVIASDLTFLILLLLQLRLFIFGFICELCVASADKIDPTGPVLAAKLHALGMFVDSVLIIEEGGSEGKIVESATGFAGVKQVLV